MDENFKKTTGGLALALALGGCGGSEPEPRLDPVTDPVAVEESIKENRARLRGLALIDVGQLVMHLPAQATACYGLVCPGWESRYHEERSHQATRLAGLVDIATSSNTDLPPRPLSEADAAVRALAALEIIEVRALTRTEAPNNSYCYNLPCPLDVAAAESENGRRVAVVFSIAEQARKNGL